MGNFLLVSAISATALFSLGRPWIGILAYYLLALLGPQYIWFWVFQDLRASFYVAVSTLLGIVVKVLNKSLDFDYLKTKMNLWVFFLWLFVAISYFLGPYVHLHDIAMGLSPKYLFENTNNICVFYLCATLVCNSTSKLRYLSYIIILAAVYLIYWANLQYFTQNWDQFYMGRLKGPESVDGGSIYKDENAFAMLFVTAIPFIIYQGLQFRRKLLRYMSWVFVIFGMHAIFLTGSRGGLLGFVVSILVIIFQSNKKRLALIIIPLFYAFYLWQAGDVMKSRSGTMNEYQEDTSSEMRITAWKGGMRMIADHPLTGVGLGSFITALPHYIETSPRVAHNTLIQFAAESGLGAGFCYLMIIYTFIVNSKRITKQCSEGSEAKDVKLMIYLKNASTASFFGLIVCSIFLSLNNYEVFFYLLIFNNILATICSQNNEQKHLVSSVKNKNIILSDSQLKVCDPVSKE